MKDKRKLSAAALSAETRLGRARKLASASLPLVAELYIAHLNACGRAPAAASVKHQGGKKRSKADAISEPAK